MQQYTEAKVRNDHCSKKIGGKLDKTLLEWWAQQSTWTCNNSPVFGSLPSMLPWHWAYFSKNGKILFWIMNFCWWLILLDFFVVFLLDFVVNNVHYFIVNWITAWEVLIIRVMGCIIIRLFVFDCDLHHICHFVLLFLLEDNGNIICHWCGDEDTT